MIASKLFTKWLAPILAGVLILAILALLLAGSGQPRVEASSCWKAAITEQWDDYSIAASVLRVAVQGKPGLLVKVRSEGGYETISYTGTKPEYGPNVAEFAPLTKGDYFIEPEGLGVSFKIWLSGHNYTRVDFTSQSCAPTATPTPGPGTATATRQPAATATRQPAATATATRPAPTPAQPAAPAAPYWRGRVAQHVNDPTQWLATIAVRVIGRPAGQDVEIRSGIFTATCKIGTKPEIAPDACEFGGLNTGVYTLTPLGLDASFQISVNLGDFALVEFHQIGLPPGAPVITGWVGGVTQNTSGSQPTEAVASAIAVVVTGKPWLDVEIRAGGWTATCTTGFKPEYGPDACEFGGLRAGTYTLTPVGLGVSAQVTMDGWGWAMVRFDPVVARSAPAPSVPAPSPTKTPSPASAAPVAGVTPTATPTPTGPRWKGWIVSNSSTFERTNISSAIVVRVQGAGGYPVHISGGGETLATCITGTKPEYGPDACEFGGLWAATYYLWPEGSDIKVTVTMDGIGIAFVNFKAP